MPATLEVPAPAAPPRSLPPAVFIERARREGLHLLRDGDALRVIGPPAVRKKPAIVAYIKRYKSEIVALLPAAQPAADKPAPVAAPASSPPVASFGVTCLAEMMRLGTDRDTCEAFAKAQGLTVPPDYAPAPTASSFADDQELMRLGAEADAELAQYEQAEQLTYAEQYETAWRALLAQAQAGTLPMETVSLGPGTSTSDPNRCALVAVGNLRGLAAKITEGHADENQIRIWRGAAEKECVTLDALCEWWESRAATVSGHPLGEPDADGWFTL